jgi:hypothetical protein
MTAKEQQIDITKQNPHPPSAIRRWFWHWGHSVTDFGWKGNTWRYLLFVGKLYNFETWSIYNWKLQSSRKLSMTYFFGRALSRCSSLLRSPAISLAYVISQNPKRKYWMHIFRYFVSAKYVERCILSNAWNCFCLKELSHEIEMGCLRYEWKAPYLEMNLW